MRKIKVAVIGVGRMGGVHAANLKKKRAKGGRLCAICDVKPEATDAFIKKHGEVASFSDYREMIETARPDACIIATEHRFHADIAIYCIERGVNVLIEKPLSVTTDDAKRVIDCAAAHPEVVCAVMFNQRTNPLYVRAKKLVESGVVGKVIRANYIVTDWYRSQAYYDQGGWRASLEGEGGGTLINQCVHQLDLIQWILGLPSAVEVKMFTKGRSITTENDVTALFEYADGVYCSFSASAHELRGTNRMEIAGEKGRIVVDAGRMKVLVFFRSEPEVNASTKKGYGTVAAKTARYGFRVGSAIEFLRGGQQLNVVKDFIRAIVTGEKPLSPVSDGLNVVEMINGMYLSAWRQRRTELPVNDEDYVRALNEKIAEERAFLHAKK